MHNTSILLNNSPYINLIEYFLNVWGLIKSLLWFVTLCFVVAPTIWISQSELRKCFTGIYGQNEMAKKKNNQVKKLRSVLKYVLLSHTYIGTSFFEKQSSGTGWSWHMKNKSYWSVTIKSDSEKCHSFIQQYEYCSVHRCI